MGTPSWYLDTSQPPEQCYYVIMMAAKISPHRFRQLHFTTCRLPRPSRQVNHPLAYTLLFIFTRIWASCNYARMSNNNNAHESTPLLRGHDGAEESGDATHHASTWQRVKSWISSHTINLILTLLLAVFVILFLVTAFIQTSGKDEDKPPSEPTPGEGAEICTSAGCVLASSTLLRSISSR